jgi:hypothetical protein
MQVIVASPLAELSPQLVPSPPAGLVEQAVVAVVAAREAQAVSVRAVLAALAMAASAVRAAWRQPQAVQAATSPLEQSLLHL